MVETQIPLKPWLPGLKKDTEQVGILIKGFHDEGVMKKSVLLFSFSLIITSIILAQTIIENPEKPLSKNAGRVIQLKEVMRITDEEGKFYFSGPWDIKIAKDGSIFVHEPNKFYKFDANGKFVKNLYKKGEGPGELNQNLTDVIIMEDEIILASSNMHKIIRMNMDGKLIQDIRPEWRFSTLIGYYNGNYFFIQHERKGFERISGIREEYLRLCAVSNGERELVNPTSIIFPIKTATYKSNKGFIGGWSEPLKRINENQRYVYLFHTHEYLIKLLDLEKIEVVRSFRRKYERVKSILPEEIRASNLLPRYISDIYRLATYKNNLWVITSTIDKKKGILVDVFNREGKYMDNFYLPLQNIKINEHFYAPMVVYGNYLFVIEIGEDELISVAKYEIID